MAEKQATKKEVQAEPLKPYVHIDKFLNSVKLVYELSDVELAGFKALMAGQHYQRDEEIFLEALKKHFNLK
ncbi:hypothetical protein D307_gp246 [Bacillus phage Bastille]|uniref:Uncharacterized protein n=6 Tax=Bastillevirus TaxID=1918010 RepID=A0A024B0B9_9CAUD|nr:hypothetical protein D307_gp246 [Bacillus phage Bastille]YP_009035281.1 hypothetical protein FP73_gp257 [Bacillus phage Hoody T]YP_009035609.1 hypothetical protein FP76_gp282 [Bacillus phage Evoli]YP_009036987.1 hypothetical protein FP74_gp275 [Bacillus phage CAM003]AMW61841.1 hypothetical protein DNAM5_97 [Bacillus phage Vinny]ASR79545.1 hypothetical protein OTK52_93 [Bacillus phage OTooleKemple52]ASR79858.1 hypothetical protein JANET_94 [Bacillus phage Janet]ASU00936.1 hypothetical prot